MAGASARSAPPTRCVQTLTRAIVGRARLRYDVQIELEVERSKKDDGALEWIERTRTLGKELDWSREEALRLDRVNQFLTKESPAR